jgi:predicted dehydrogenase
LAELKAALIGFGNIAQEHFKGFQAAQGVTLIAVADPSQQRLQPLRHTGITTFSDAHEMLRIARPDVVSICTPPSTHAGLATAAFAARAHVFCEKPLAHTTAAARQMISAAASADRLLGVAFCHRFIPAIQRIRELLAANAIGAPLLYRNQFSGPFTGVEKSWFSNPELSGGGTLMDTTVHSVDLFRYLIGEVDHVRALASTMRPELRVEDTSILLVQSGACLGTLEASWTVAPGTLLIEVRGTEGELFYDYDKLRWRTATGEWNEEQFPEGIDNRFAHEIQHFINACRGETQLQLTATDGLRSLEILEQAYLNLSHRKS